MPDQSFNLYSLYDTLAPLRGLIIDDFPQFRQTLKAMLFRLGMQSVDQAANGSEAIRMCMENEYDVIFCDYNLGEGQDGQQVLEELHERDIMHKGMLFLMVTAESASIQVIAAIEYRPDAYLTKPFTGEQLGQRLKRLLDKQQVLKPLHDAINNRQYDRALALCDSIMQEKPTSRFSCLRLKTEVLETLKRYDEAMTIYQEVVDQQPLLWAVLGIGRVVYLQGDIEGALQRFQTMKADFPQQVSVLDWIAKCQQELGEKEAARASMMEAIAISPKSVRRQHGFAEASLELGEIEDAQKAFEKTVLVGRGSCLSTSDHYRKYFTTTREIVPNLSDRDKHRLVSHIDNIGKHMERKFRDDPGSMAANFSALSRLYSGVGKKDQAQGSLSKLNKTLQNPDARISPEDFEQIKVDIEGLNEADFNGKTVEQLHDRMAGAQQQAVLQQQQAQDAHGINSEGLQLARQQKPIEALKKFREAQKLAPYNHNYALNAAQIILGTDDLKKQPHLMDEARDYLSGVNLESSGDRWRIYKKLVEQLADE